jgi:hypothetical protein
MAVAILFSAKPTVADPLLDFNIDIVWGTLTVQTGSGTVLQTFNDLDSSQALPTDLGDLIAADPIAPTYVQNNISQLVGTGESTLDFLDQPPNSFPPVLLSVSGTVSTLSGDTFDLVTSDLETISFGPVTSTTPEPTGEAALNDQYGLSGSNPIPTIVNVNFFKDSVTETVATPEPAALALPALALLAMDSPARRWLLRSQRPPRNPEMRSFRSARASPPEAAAPNPLAGRRYNLLRELRVGNPKGGPARTVAAEGTLAIPVTEWVPATQAATSPYFAPFAPDCAL